MGRNLNNEQIIKRMYERILINEDNKESALRRLEREDRLLAIPSEEKDRHTSCGMLREHTDKDKKFIDNNAITGDGWCLFNLPCIKCRDVFIELNKDKLFRKNKNW